MAWVNTVIAVALLEYFVFLMAVGWARGKFKVAAPATTGHEVFERYYRVQMNTLEALVLFVPAVWLYGTYVSAQWAAILGAVFIVGRALYFVGYTRDPKKRGIGYLVGFVPTVVLSIGALIGAVRAAL